MNLAEARAALDDRIHSPVRLTLMAALNSVDSVDYQTLREELGVSYSLLSKHAGILEGVGYLRITKAFAGRTPTTRMSVTRAGRDAFERHLGALDRIMQGLT
ncbi:winged helix-turn-helix domain-containing protein [Corynebacterium pacaense]|uniref:winged helix-turn-helix domain-containing protein n=1 Tax=Corynebacterium pacaense TaxID=1816684 RepID=UPI0009BC653B|nr:transcriptional regulator [Corynebacterium pacaense]